MKLFDKFKNILSKNKEEVEDYSKGLEKTRVEFTNKLGILNKKYKKITDEYFEELEEVLISADIGVNTVMDFIDRLRKRVKRESITNTLELRNYN